MIDHVGIALQGDLAIRDLIWYCYGWWIQLAGWEVNCMTKHEVHCNVWIRIFGQGLHEENFFPQTVGNWKWQKSRPELDAIIESQLWDHTRLIAVGLSMKKKKKSMFDEINWPTYWVRFQSGTHLIITSELSRILTMTCDNPHRLCLKSMYLSSRPLSLAPWLSMITDTYGLLPICLLTIS